MPVHNDSRLPSMHPHPGDGPNKTYLFGGGQPQIVQLTLRQRVASQSIDDPKLVKHAFRMYAFTSKPGMPIGTLVHIDENSKARKPPTACCSSNLGSEVKELSSVSKYVSKCLTMVVGKPSFTAEADPRAVRRMLGLDVASNHKVDKASKIATK